MNKIAKRLDKGELRELMCRELCRELHEEEALTLRAEMVNLHRPALEELFKQMGDSAELEAIVSIYFLGRRCCEMIIWYGISCI